MIHKMIACSEECLRLACCDFCRYVIQDYFFNEDKDGNMKVTEVNIRHMAYAGVMAHVGFDLIEDTIKILEDGNADRVERDQYHYYEKPFVFLRDVDVEPIILESEEFFDDAKVKF